LGTKEIKFQSSVPEAAIWIHPDRNALGRLLLILVDNAVKYTPQGGTVRLGIEAVNSHVEVRVQDTGIGIPDDDLPHVFERFYRSDKARSRNHGGAGLGLSIEQWIAKAHGAEIRVESSPSGSLFVLNIPLALENTGS
jgi:signal transduction histidine kinase